MIKGNCLDKLCFYNYPVVKTKSDNDNNNNNNNNNISFFNILFNNNCIKYITKQI